MDFAGRALPLIALGINIIPLKPRTKDAYWTGWPQILKEAKRLPDPEQIAIYSSLHPDDNVGVVAEEILGKLIIVDVDKPEFREEIERKTGVRLDDTMTVRSGRPDGTGRHHYYRQTGLTLKLLHNPRFPGMGQVQTWHQYVVGPGSIHPSGNPYVALSENFIPMPEALVQFFAERAAKGKQRLKHVGLDDGVSATLEEKREWIDNFLFTNGWEVYGDWRPGTWADGVTPALKMDVLCCNHAQHTPGVPISRSCSTIIIAEGFGFGYYCQRDHCRGQLEWGDFRRMVEEVPDVTAWKKPVERPSFTVKAPVEEPTETPEEKPEAPPIIHREQAGDFPMDIMDTRLGQVAKKLDAPPAWSFFTTASYYAVQGVNFVSERGVNFINTNTILVGVSGSGKTRTCDRSRRSFVFDVGTEIITTKISSDNSLVLALDGAKEEDIGSAVRRVLIYQDDGQNMLKKNDIPGNSGICFAFDELFSDTYYVKKIGNTSTKKGFRASVNLLLGLTLDSPAQFADYFGELTVDGFYRRIVIADGPDDWEGDDSWRPDPVILRPTHTISEPRAIENMKKEWVHENKAERKNLGEYAIRFAGLITSAMNLAPDCQVPGMTEIPGVVPEPIWTVGITGDAMELSLRLMAYVQRMKRIYRPGRADNTTEAKCTEQILRGLDVERSERGENVCLGLRDFRDRFHLDRKGAPVVERVLKSLKMAHIIFEGVLEEGSRKRWIRLLTADEVE